MSKVIIYGLFDPRNAECFYVGKTITKLSDRLYKHINVKKQNNPHKLNKINQILSCGLKPQIAELLTIDDYYDEVLQAHFHEYVEMYFIQYAKDVLHCPLVNISKGGDGGDNKSINYMSVSQFTKAGEFIETFKSMSEAYRKTGINISGIRECCKHINNRISAGGFQWCYKGNEDKIGVCKIDDRIKPVFQFTLKGELINKYTSQAEAYKITGIKTISNCCLGKQKQGGGYKWSFSSN
jgi:hypothetical protein